MATVSNTVPKHPRKLQQAQKDAMRISEVNFRRNLSTGYLARMFSFGIRSIRSHCIPFNDIIIFTNLDFSGFYDKNQVPYENHEE